MNWFKENKFLGGLLTVNLIIAAFIIYLGMKTGGKKEADLAEVDQHLIEKASAKKLDPFPTPENVDAKNDSLKAMIAKASAAQVKALSFSPESIEKITVSSFADRLKNADSSVRGMFADKNIRLADEAYLGFEKYKGAAPIEAATGILAFELAGIEWLFSELADAGITEVTNFTRDELAIEKAAPVSSGKKRRKTKKKPSRSKKRSSGPSLPMVDVAEKLPMSLTFKGSEDSVRKALQGIANSDKHFFQTRVFRVQNPAPTPSSSGVAIKRAPVVEKVEEDGGFGPVAGDDQEAADAAPIGPKQILHRVAGGEDVSVFLKLDLLLFSNEQSFPEIK